MLNVYLVRHGETEWNADGNRYCGRTDLPLIDKGLQQVEATKKELKETSFDQVYSSPLQRSLKTAQIVSGQSDIVTDKRLIEVDFGGWEGKPKEEFIPENEELWNNWLSDPAENRAGGTGETGREVIDRVEDFFRSLITNKELNNVLVVAHNGVNRLFLSYKLGMPLGNYRKFSLNNSSVIKFTLDENMEIVLESIST